MRWDLWLAWLALVSLAINTGVGLVVLAGASPGDLTRQRLAVAVLGAAAMWLLLDGAVEGRTLVTLARGHGVTVADLVSVPALTVAAALLV